MKNRFYIKSFFISIFFIFIFHNNQNAQSFAGQSGSAEGKVKYVFLFIGDGMGLAEVNLTEAYQAAVEGKVGLERLNFTKFPNVGLVSTYTQTELITCSAAAGTALATGHKTSSGRISMDTAGKAPFESIATKAKQAGFRVGIVTSVSIDHATPSVFYAHQPDRDMYFSIGRQLPGSNFDYFAGGGFLDPDSVINGVNVNLVQEAKNAGYKVADTRAAFQQLVPGSGNVLVISPHVATEASMPFYIDMNPDDITLADFTAKGIELLDNDKGFFMMVEGGKIDWAGHDNDAATLLQEVKEFDNAIAQAVEFYQKHSEETMIIVTADHETGGLALGNNALHYDSNLGILQYQKSSEVAMKAIVADFRAKRTTDTIAEFNRMLKALENDLGLNSRLHGTVLDSNEMATLKALFIQSVYDVNTENAKYGYTEAFISEAVAIMNKKAGVSWGTGSHTAINVPVYSIGPGSELLSGYIDNTDIPKTIGMLMGVE